MPQDLPPQKETLPDSKPRSPIRRFGGWLLLLVVVNLAVRLPLCWDPANVDNDGAEYLAIARHLRTAGKYATDLKWQFFTDDSVRHAAWADRPPLYPCFAVLCQRLLPFLDPTAAARVGNALLACGALVLVALYLRRLYGERIALLATGYVFLLPHMLYWTTQPMTETLTLALTYGALLISPRRHGDTEQHGEDGRGEERDPGSSRYRPAFCALGAGMLIGLAYLARPTGAVLLPALLLDQWLCHRRQPLVGGSSASPVSDCTGPTTLSPAAPTPTLNPTLTPIPTPRHSATPPLPHSATPTPRHPATPPPRHSATPTLLLGFALLALPFHLWLWHLYGSPTHSALGFTFAVRTYYEVSYYGFGAGRPTVGAMLAQHGWEIPGLVLHQVWRHVQALIPPLVGLLPLAYWMRRSDWDGERRAAGLYVLLLILAHTITWAAWGSSRYFLPCFPILVAGLLSVAERRDDRPPRWLSRVCVWCTGAGLLVAALLFFRTQLRPDHGLPSLPLWREAASTVRGCRLVAADKPSVLNLLLETPAVRLPRTTDPQLLARFVREYRPDALVLFADEPGKQPQAAAWRNGALPPGWRLVVNRSRLLIARPAAAAPGTG